MFSWCFESIRGSTPLYTFVVRFDTPGATVMSNPIRLLIAARGCHLVVDFSSAVVYFCTHRLPAIGNKKLAWRRVPGDLILGPLVFPS